jgi:hypothetical protein
VRVHVNPRPYYNLGVEVWRGVARPIRLDLFALPVVIRQKPLREIGETAVRMVDGVPTFMNRRQRLAARRQRMKVPRPRRL